MNPFSNDPSVRVCVATIAGCAIASSPKPVFFLSRCICWLLIVAQRDRLTSPTSMAYSC